MIIFDYIQELNLNTLVRKPAETENNFFTLKNKEPYFKNIDLRSSREKQLTSIIITYKEMVNTIT